MNKGIFENERQAVSVVVQSENESAEGITENAAIRAREVVGLDASEPTPATLPGSEDNISNGVCGGACGNSGDCGGDCAIERQGSESAPEKKPETSEATRTARHPATANLRQYADPAGHRAAIIERNKTGLPSTKHGLQAFRRGGGVRCLDSTCPLIRREDCEHMPDADKSPCVVVAAYEARRFDELMAVDWIRPTDAPSVRALIKNEILIELCESWFLRSGHFKRKKGENPAISIYQTALRAYAAAANELGLNPASRQRLGLDALRGESIMQQITRKAASDEHTEK